MKKKKKNESELNIKNDGMPFIESGERSILHRENKNIHFRYAEFEMSTQCPNGDDE